MRTTIVVLCALGVPAALATADEPAPIAEPSVAAVLATLRADATAEFREQRGWTVVASREGAHAVEWFFTPEGHEAHPAVVKRTAYDQDGVGFIDLAVLCQVEEPQCERLLVDFRQRHERDVAAAAPERVLLDVAIALDDHERMRVERMLVAEGLAAEIRFTDVLKLVVVPTLDDGRVLLWTAVYEFDGSDYVLLGEPRFASPGGLSGFDLCSETAGSTQYMKRIGADTIQRVCTEYAAKRNAVRKQKLRWRVSRGARRSLGWVPFKAASVKRKGKQVRFAGKTFRVFEAERLDGVQWKQGCFAQDAMGDWWLCLPVERAVSRCVAPREAVGIDLGLASVATTSDGETLEAARFYRDAEQRLAHAQRRGHQRQAKRLHRRAANRRRDALHKFSRRIVDQYQNIVVGDVSASKLARTRLAKSVLDSGWGMLRQMLQYKGEHAGRSVEVVSERNTSRVCSQCGALKGPQGLRQLAVRAWTCSGCGEPHDRDVNAARNILARAKVLASVSGNESSDSPVPPSRLHRRREAGTETARTAA